MALVKCQVLVSTIYFCIFIFLTSWIMTACKTSECGFLYVHKTQWRIPLDYLCFYEFKYIHGLLIIHSIMQRIFSFFFTLRIMVNIAGKNELFEQKKKLFNIAREIIHNMYCCCKLQCQFDYWLDQSSINNEVKKSRLSYDRTG